MTRTPRAKIYRTGVESPSGQRTSSPLTNRQAQVLYLRSRGMERAQIAEHLGIAEETVLRHIKDSLKRANAVNQVHLISIAIRSGWI